MVDKTHKKTHVSEAKKKRVKELAELLKNSKTVMVLSIKSLPSPQFQEIKKSLRSKGKIVIAKKSLIDFALEHSANENLRELEKYVEADYALLFSDEDAFVISGILSDSKSPAKAKPGQISPEDIYAEAGPTELVPGPDISALSAVGLKVKVENGKLAIQQKAILCRSGEVISPEKAAIMAKLNIIPFKIGVEPIAAYSDGKVYSNIKINKTEFMETMQNMYGKAFAFAVNLAYLNKETLPFVLGKAASHKNALKGLIKTDTVAEEKKQEASVEEVKEEPKTEEIKVEGGN